VLAATGQSAIGSQTVLPNDHFNRNPDFSTARGHPDPPLTFLHSILSHMSPPGNFIIVIGRNQ
jgi:hypothetical protein